jgi:hypothetical protein
LLIVSLGVSIGSPAPIAACRAGACRRPLQHLAHDHVLRLVRLDPARSSAARIAIEPSSSAGRDREPPRACPTACGRH